MRLRTWLIVPTLLLLLQGAALAEGNPDAKELFTRATAHYDLGKYLQAAEEFEKLYELVPDQVVLLYNIAQAYRLGGDNQKAMFFYRAFLRRVPESPKKAEVRKRLEALEKLQVDEKKTRDAAPTEIDRSPKPPEAGTPVKPPGETPTEPTARPGETAAKPGETAARPGETPTEPTARPGEPTARPEEAKKPEVAPPPEQPKKADMLTLPEEPPPPPPKKPVYKKGWFWGVIVGVVAVGAGAGVAAYLLTRPTETPFTPNFPEVGPNIKSSLVSF